MEAGTVRAWAVAAARGLDAAREPIDVLNVFPVPDGDTGTNLALTIGEAAEHLGEVGRDATAAEVAAAFARGALLGARGNSGVIVSQYLHGFARGLAAGGRSDAVLLAGALHEAQLAARAAVAQPVEGTILTAGEAAAAAAGAAARVGDDVRTTASAAVVGARGALARSPQTLDVLRAAGVVDAGATGLVVLLGALAEALGAPVTTATSTLRTVSPRSPSPGTPTPGTPTPGTAPPGTVSAGTVSPGAGLRPGTPAAQSGAVADPWASGAPHPRDDGEFEVMFVVEPAADPADGAHDAAGDGGRTDLAPALSRRLQDVGTSVAVVGGPDGWHVHVHTDDPAAAVAAGDVGERSQVVVRRLVAPAVAEGLGVVAGTSAPGLIADLARAGALVLVHAGRPVTARDVRRAVLGTGEPRVVVLPGSVAALAAARGAAGLAGPPARTAGRTDGVDVEVLDAADDLRVVVGLTADPGAGADRVAAMRAALAVARTGGVDEPDVAAVLTVARRLLDDGGELVTVLRGAALDAVAPGDALLDALTDGLAATHPDAEVVVLAGGQATPAAALAVE